MHIEPSINDILSQEANLLGTQPKLLSFLFETAILGIFFQTRGRLLKLLKFYDVLIRYRVFSCFVLFKKNTGLLLTFRTRKGGKSFPLAVIAKMTTACAPLITVYILNNKTMATFICFFKILNQLLKSQMTCYDMVLNSWQKQKRLFILTTLEAFETKFQNLLLAVSKFLRLVNN